MPRLPALTAVAVALLLCAAPASAFLDDPDAAPLRGAPRALHITVADVGPDAARAGITEDRLFAAAAAQLSAAGFTVADSAPAAAHLGVGLAPVRGAGLVAYTVRFSYDQPALLERDSSVAVTAPTWLVLHTGAAFSAKLRDAVVGAVERLANRFRNSFDAVNPPG